MGPRLRGDDACGETKRGGIARVNKHWKARVGDAAAPRGAAVEFNYLTRVKTPLAQTPPVVQPSSDQLLGSLSTSCVL